jgi:DNA-binding NtrC family response regulator
LELTMTVLIVDDEQAMRELVSRWLASDGFNILQAADADSAVRLLENHPVAVALCDRAMPGRDGDWLVGQIRARFPAVAIILATADDSVPTRISLRDGVIGYLVKPFVQELLHRAVHDGVAWHQAAAKAGARREAAADAIDSWLRGRAGRPEPQPGD